MNEALILPDEHMVLNKSPSWLQTCVCLTRLMNQSELFALSTCKVLQSHKSNGSFHWFLQTFITEDDMCTAQRITLMGCRYLAAFAQ